ncbi:MAG: hypothetical protein M3171_02285 [Actinomycetota bacterium]|nr:hypothetical protein [Actinomycetota bacterium]
MSLDQRPSLHSRDSVDHLDAVRTVADAVLYEGYLLYPYRASSAKNQSRWQFGVLGPPGASAAGLGEDSGMSMECLVAARDQSGSVTVHLRFLQLQVREAQRLEADGRHVPVESLAVGAGAVLSWDEAVEREVTLPAQALLEPLDTVVGVPGGEDVEPVADDAGGPAGQIVRRRCPLTAQVRMLATPDDGFVRLSVSVDNTHTGEVPDKDAAIRSSLIGAHLIVEARDADFVSLLEPPEAAAAAAGRCHQRRCWPVLAGGPGRADVVLGSPIILYDHPEVAEQSQGALFDSTEIDEILTLRVMTMTPDEKAQARATDPRAAAIVDRCDEMTAADLQQLHGILRNPLAGMPASPVAAYADLREADLPTFETGDVPWWDPEADASVQPETDAVVINGVRVAKGSLVRVHPSRRADAQDLFLADQVARVTAVLSDVDGQVHVALVLVDDPAADLHEWYGRYLYFSPDELEPLPAQPQPAQQTHRTKESRP